MMGVRWKRYWRFAPLIASSYIKDDIELYMVYFILAKGEKGCHFSEAFGVMLFYKAVAVLPFQPLLAWITDRTANHSSKVLALMLLVELGLTLVLVLVPVRLEGVIALQMARTLAQQLNFSQIWKIFKQSMDSDGVSVPVQTQILTRVGMGGIFFEVFVDTAFCFFAYFVVNSLLLDYETVSIICYSVTLGTNVLCLCVNFSLTNNFVFGSKAIDLEDEIGEDSKLTQNSDIEETVLLRTSFFSGLLYYKTAALEFYRAKVGWACFVHSSLVFVMWTLMSSAAPLSLGGGDIPPDATTTNFCGGLFRNIFLLGTFSYGGYVIGAILFAIFLTRVKPLLYFKVVYPLIAILLVALLVPFYFDLPADVKAALVATSISWPWYLYRYDGFLMYADVPGEFAGAVSAMVGVQRYLTPLLPAFFLIFDTPTWVMITLAISLTFVTVVHSVFVARRHHVALEKIAWD